MSSTETQSDPYLKAIGSIQSVIDSLERDRARQNADRLATICRLQLAIVDLLNRRAAAV
jgi:hypothetical protein